MEIIHTQWEKRRRKIWHHGRIKEGVEWGKKIACNIFRNIKEVRNNGRMERT